MSGLIERALSQGEISPYLAARSDLAQYGTGLAVAVNMKGRKDGGMDSRAGLLHEEETKGSGPAITIPFEFNETETYEMEFGDNYIRWVQNGSYLKVENLDDWDATVNYMVGDLVKSAGINYYCIADNMNQAPANAAYWYPLTDDIYEIPSPYTAEQAKELDHPQTGDLMKLLSIDLPVYNLVRHGQTRWVLGPAPLAPTQPSLSRNLTGTVGVVGTGNYYILVTTLDPVTKKESLAGTALVGAGSKTISVIIQPPKPPGGPQPNAIIETLTAHGFSTGNTVMFSGLVWPAGVAPNLNGMSLAITVISATGFTIPVVLTGAPTGPMHTGGTVTVNAAATSGITAISQTFPCTVTTVAAHNLLTGDLVRIEGTGIKGIDDLTFPAFKIDANNFILTGLDPTVLSIPAVVSGFFYPCVFELANCDSPTFQKPNVYSWDEVLVGNKSYNVYASPTRGGLFGFIGNTMASSFTDEGVPPAYSKNPPIYQQKFQGDGNYPSVGAFYQQRFLAGGTKNDPAGISGSRIGDFEDFSISIANRDDDALNFILAAPQVNRVRHLIEARRLVAFNAAVEYAIRGDQSGALLPNTPNATIQSREGASTVKPLIADGNIIFVHANGNILRDLTYNFMQDRYAGDDLNVFSKHLLEGFKIVKMAYQNSPDCVLWIVRNDGIALSLTYFKTEKVLCWTRHITDGFIEWVSVEKTEDEEIVTFVVKRTIDGQDKRFIERLAPRQFTDIRDFIGLDACVTFDGRNAGAGTMMLSGGTNWTNTETLTLTSSLGEFKPEYTGGAIQFTTGGDSIRFTIINFTDQYTVTGKVQKTVPVALRTTATTDWALALKKFTGLDHLEAKNVGVVGDGFEVANSLDKTKPVITVAGGFIELPNPYAVVHIGLNYSQDLKTLAIDNPQGETFADKKMIIRQVGVMVKDSRGFFAGKDFPTGDDPVEGMQESKVRSTEPAGTPIRLKSEVIFVKIKSGWGYRGQVAVRNIRALPFTVLALLPGGTLPIQQRGGA